MRAKSFARRDKTHAKGQEIVVALLIFNVNTNIYTGKKPSSVSVLPISVFFCFVAFHTTNSCILIITLP
jgi:hypothetical protein